MITVQLRSFRSSNSNPKDSSSESEIRVFYESESTAVLGRETKPKKKLKSTSWKKRKLNTVSKQLFGLSAPFVNGVVPASNREEDEEWTSGWSDDGAEVRMTKREARLKGVAP